MTSIAKNGGRTPRKVTRVTLNDSTAQAQPAAPDEPTGAKIASDFVTAFFVSRTKSPFNIAAFTNEKGKGAPKNIFTRASDKIEAFVKTNDKPGWAVYFGVNPIIAGKEVRNKENVAEIIVLHADIDFKGLVEGRQAIIEALKRLPKPPSLVVFSGHGIHCYWFLKEPMPTSDKDRVEACLKQIARVLAGDPAVCEIARVMRLPGSHNSKDNDWLEAEDLGFRGPDYEFKELEKWFASAEPVLTARVDEKPVKEKPRTNGHDPEEYNPFARLEKELDFKVSIDHEELLSQMRYKDPHGHGVDVTQLRIMGSMLARGYPPNEVIDYLIVETFARIDSTGWSQDTERSKLRDMCTRTFLNKKFSEHLKEQDIGALPTWLTNDRRIKKLLASIPNDDHPPGGNGAALSWDGPAETPTADAKSEGASGGSLEQTQENEDRISKGLLSITTVFGGDEWVEIGKALQSLDWKVGANDWGFAVWNKWSKNKLQGYTNSDDLVARWKEWGDHDVTIDKLFELVKLKTKLMQSSAEFVAGYVPPDYLIDGLLQRRYVYSLTAPTGSGKTAIALLFAAHVANGLLLGNREVEKGRVLMFAGENPDDVRSRWILLCEKMGINPDAMDVVFMPFTPKLSENEIRKRIDAEAAEHGPFSLLIVDTSAAYYSGDDENDNVALGNHARMLRSFVNLPGGPTIIVTCHPTKNANMENLLPRGGDAFLAEVDGNLVAIKDDTEMTVSTTWHGKFRGPDFPPFSFKLVRSRSDKLVDTKGRKVWSVYAEQISDEEQEAIAMQRNREQDALLRAMLDHPGFSLKEMAEHLGWRTKTGGEYGVGGEPNKVKVQRMMDGLKKIKLVEKRRDGHYVLTDKGEKEAENTPEDNVREVEKQALN